MRLVIAGGGTGGHLFPGIALAEELRARGGHEVLFVGTARGIEARVVPQQGWRLELIDVGGIKGMGPLGMIKNVLRVPRSLWQSRAILRKFDADMVVGVGGYASGPVVMAAALAGRATAILEQNSIPGITNRILGRVVQRVYTSFEHSHRFFPPRKLRALGNPIRAQLRAAADAASHNDAAATQQARVLVLGGSQGAHAVNEKMVEAMALLQAEGRAPHLVHQTGAADRAPVEERYRKAGVEAEVREFIADMAGALAAADLVVGRAGATTIAELTAFGRASLLIPFPFATDDHQRLNARALVDAGAARVFDEKDLAPRQLADAIAELCGDAAKRAAMADAARTLGRPAAASAIVDELLELVDSRSHKS